jgi:hypothetical protein
MQTASQTQPPAIPTTSLDVGMDTAMDDVAAPDRTSTGGIKRKAGDAELAEEENKRAKIGEFIIVFFTSEPTDRGRFQEQSVPPPKRSAFL